MSRSSCRCSLGLCAALLLTILLLDVPSSQCLRLSASVRRLPLVKAPLNALTVLTSVGVLLAPLDAEGLAAQQPALSQQDLRTITSAYDAYGSGDYAAANDLFSQALQAWARAGAPSDELGALHKLRGNARARLRQFDAALQDYDAAVDFVTDGRGAPDPAEIPDTYKARARCEERLGLLARAEQDYSRALQLFEDLDIGGGDLPNPFLLSDRGRVRLRAGKFADAVGDLTEAQKTFGAIGDRPRANIARADLALAEYGAGRAVEAVVHWADLARTVRDAVSRDIPLLQELSRREAEAHLALAAVYWEKNPLRAEGEWNEGCERLDATLTDAFNRREGGGGAEGGEKGGGRGDSVEPSEIALCTKFRDLAWVQRERYWPQTLTDRLGAFLGTQRVR